MAGKMHLLVLRQTGHVLAAYCKIPGGNDPALDEICGADFTVGSVRTRGAPDTPLAVPVARDQLELRSAPRDDAVLANPRGFVADGSTATPIVGAPPGLTVTLSSSSISAGFTEKTFVALNRSDDGSERRLALAPATTPFSPMTLKTSPAAAVDSAISAGGVTYDVLIALPGRPLILTRIVAT